MQKTKYQSDTKEPGVQLSDDILISVNVDKMSAPVVAFGAPEMLAASWYGYVWEKAHVRGEFCEPDMDIIAQERTDLATFLTTVMYLRWARLADVDFEPALKEQIEKALNETRRFTENITISDTCTMRNKEDFVFGDEDKMDAWLGETIAHIANDCTRDICDEDFIYMFSERGPKSKPMFKASGWEHSLAIAQRELWIEASCIANSRIKYWMFPDVTHDNTEDDFMACEEVSEEELRDLACASSPRGACDDEAALKYAVLVSSEDEDINVWESHQALMLLHAVGRIGDDARKVVIISRSCGNRAKEHCRQVLNDCGLQLLFDFSVYDDQSRLPAILSDEISNDGNITRHAGYDNNFVYMGPVSGNARRKIADIRAVEAASTVFSRVASYYEQARWSESAYEAKAVKQARHRAACLTNVIDKMSFGHLSCRNISLEAYMDSNKNRLLNSLYCYRDDLKPEKMERDILGTLDLYINMGILPERYGTYSETDDTDKALEDMCAAAEKCGIDVLLSALDQGIAIEDITCGISGQQGKVAC